LEKGLVPKVRSYPIGRRLRRTVRPKVAAG
jgi:hypothetical protein